MVLSCLRSAAALWDRCRRHRRACTIAQRKTGQIAIEPIQPYRQIICGQIGQCLVDDSKRTQREVALAAFPTAADPPLYHAAIGKRDDDISAVDRVVGIGIEVLRVDQGLAQPDLRKRDPVLLEHLGDLFLVAGKAIWAQQNRRAQRQQRQHARHDPQRQQRQREGKLGCAAEREGGGLGASSAESRVATPGRRIDGNG